MSDPEILVERGDYRAVQISADRVQMQRRRDGVWRPQGHTSLDNWPCWASYVLRRPLAKATRDEHGIPMAEAWGR